MEALSKNGQHWATITDSGNLSLKSTVFPRTNKTSREEFGETPHPRMRLKVDSVIECEVLGVYSGSIDHSNSIQILDVFLQILRFY